MISEGVTFGTVQVSTWPVSRTPQALRMHRRYVRNPSLNHWCRRSTRCRARCSQ
jgi:hypothetical protein